MWTPPLTTAPAFAAVNRERVAGLKSSWFAADAPSPLWLMIATAVPADCEQFSVITLGDMATFDLSPLAAFAAAGMPADETLASRIKTMSAAVSCRYVDALLHTLELKVSTAQQPTNMLPIRMAE